MQDIEPPLLITTAGYAQWKKGSSYARKHSAIFGIELVCAGNAELVQDGKRYLIQSGEAYLLRKNASHSYNTGPEGILLKRFITMEGSALDYLLRISNLWGLDRIRLRSPRRFADLLKKATALLAQNPPGVDILCSTLAYRILLELGHSVRPTLPPVIEKALEYIQQNLHCSLSTRDMCYCLGISQTHLNRLFRQHIQCSPVKFFLQQKLTWAGHLLRSTSLSIKEIAVIAGYDDPLYFSARFKKQFGISPKKFRHSTRKEGTIHKQESVMS